MLEAASLFTDGAVLCREKEIRIFGRTDGMIVTARLTDHLGGLLAEGAADAADGRFVICLPPQHAQTGCCLVLESDTDRITAAEIAIGDVYLAGGQSNMEMELRNAAGGTEQVQEDPWLRFYNVPKKPLVNEEQQQAVRSTRWQPVTRENAGFNSAVAMYFGMAMRRKHPEIPVGIIGCYWGGTSVTCWMDQETLRSLAEGIRYLDEYDALCGGKTMEAYLAEEAEAQRKIDAWERLTESMLQEVFPAALTAILFYQGEEDTWKTEHYDLLLEAMIRFWRKGFRDPELPFLFVQLPMWIQYDGEDTFTWAQTRLAQAAVRDRVRNTGMICLLDEGEYGNTHPLNKRPVGERLAEMAGKKLYGEGTEAPRAAGKEVNGSVMTIRMTQPLRTRDGEAPALLEIAGADGRYVPARGEIRGCELRISAEGVPRPVSARYAWTDWSERVNLCGENGLPAEPFLM